MAGYRVRASSNGTAVELILDQAGHLRPAGTQRRKTSKSRQRAVAQARAQRNGETTRHTPPRRTSTPARPAMAPATDD